MLKELTSGQFFNLGFQEEISYWNSLCVAAAVPQGTTVVDAMVSYLSSQGYTGTPKDMLNAYLQAQESMGFIGDNARKLVGYK